MVKIICKYCVTYTYSEYPEPQLFHIPQYKHACGDLTTMPEDSEQASATSRISPMLDLNPNSPRSVTSPHLSDEQIPLHTSISYTAKTYENLSVLGAACLSSIPPTPQPRQQQRLHYTWGPTKPCGWRLANAWGAWLGLITAVVRFAVITIGEIMAIRTLVSGAVPIFLETVTLPLLPRSTVLITSSLAPSACIAITSS